MNRRSLLLSSPFAVLALGDSAAPSPREQARSDQPIGYVEGHKDIKFIRDGREYSAAEAGRFLRGEMDAKGGEVTSAREFIEPIASRSSTSGKPYQVKFADRRTMPSAQCLGDELTRLEARP